MWWRATGAAPSEMCDSCRVVAARGLDWTRRAWIQRILPLNIGSVPVTATFIRLGLDAV